MLRGKLPVLLLSMLLLCMGASGSLAQSNTPQANLVATFLDHWNTDNYEAMYAMIAPQSRELYTPEVFTLVYQNAKTAAGTSGITYTIHDTRIQGNSAAITYDLLMESTIFETIDDPDRTMRLVLSDEGWKIAWSTMDIFDGMAGGATLQAVSTRAPRGNIYDRNGLPVVQMGGSVVALYVQRQSIPNESQCLDLMANLLRRQRQDLETLFNRFTGETVFYVGEVDADVYNANEGVLSNTCASRYFQRTTRNYYRGNAVSTVTGYVGQVPADELALWESRGYQGGELIGRNGIELAFESELSGQAERVLQVREAGGTLIRELGRTTGSPPQNLTLTIDRELQAGMAQVIAEAYNYAEGNWGNRSISSGTAAVMIDVKTGAILAMASYPFYEPDIFDPETACCQPIPAGNRIADLVADQRQPLLNRIFQQQYPPGSVFKIITTAAVANEGLFGIDEIFDCTAQWDGRPFGDSVRTDWTVIDNLPPTGPITMSGALTTSCDPFYYQMGVELYNRVRPAAISEYARRMGLGTASGINYYGREAIGQLPVPPNLSENINNAIGQGNIAASPIQIVKMVAGVANGGTIYQPYLVEQVGGFDGTPITFEAEPQIVGTMDLSQETLEVLWQGMCDVTATESGTGWESFGNAPYTACGKTSTSQTSRQPHAWFAAYAPMDDPQVAVVVIAEHSREGSEVAAPMVRNILDIYFNSPRFGFPLWWYENDYIPMNIPEGMTGG